MADKELVSHQQQFVEEINYDEIETEQVVGKGSFGVVWKGKWKGQYVAIKYINSEGEKKAFTIEVRQLSRVIHPNIVKLYGACTKNPVCLVMEYAEGGSLYNVLHCNPQPQYTAGHAMSWALQCARGVAYLHNMKPKPLIHRDLKPPNLLLVMGGQTLKICDFGTACDLNTYMTNNKGSAAWMAPEVFEGSRYTEKCDVFSWGVILWEILSRKKPFDEIGGSAYRIMWAVHIGQRPPLIEGCPKPLEDLMTRCWHKSPEERPSMDEVVEIMTILSQFFNEHLEPVEYSRNIESEKINENHISKDDTLDVTDSMNSEINGYAANGTIKINVPVSKENSEILNGRNNSSNSFYDFKNSSSKNNISSNIVSNKKFQIKDFPQLYVECDPNAWELPNSDPSLESSILKIKNTTQSNSTTDKDLDNVYRLLDADLRPLTPDQTCERSKEIFEEHKQLAQEYLKVQTEIALLGQHKNEMLKNLTIDSLRQQEELRKLEDEKESLIKLYRNLKRQLEIMKNQRMNNVLLSNAQMDPTVSGNNGWFVGGSLGSEESYDDMRQLVGEKKEESGKFTSLPLASFNFINSIIGSGVIGIPYALHQAGFGLGIILLILIAGLTDYSLILMVRSGNICGEMSYQGLMRASFGRTGFYILTSLQFIYPFIAMVSYNVVVGDTVTKVLIRITGISETSIFAHRQVVVFFATACITIPLCLYRNVARLAKISFLSLVCVGFILLAILIRMDTMSTVVPNQEDSWRIANFRGIVPSVGIMAFAFMCHHNTFLIYESIERATQQKWDIVTHWSLFTSFLIAAAFGIIGYATFTSYVQGDLMENYCWDDDLMNFARLMFSGTILLTFPIECFVTREVILTAIKGTDELEDHTTYVPNSDRKYLIITLTIVVVAYLISMSTDCLGVVLELNGILAAVPLAYVLPGLCYLKLEEGSVFSSKKLPALGLMTAGMFAATSGLLLLILNRDTSGSCVHGKVGSSSHSLISKCIRMEVSKNEQIVDTYEKIYGDECRICLKKAVEICELFRNGDTIPRKLMAVASVQVKEGDGLPPIICLSCNQRLDASYNFKCQIQNSDTKLRQILKLKSSSNDSVTSTSIVTAIIADVISSVISSEKENIEKQEVCPTNFCPENFCFIKDETSFCLNTQENLFCHDKELENQSQNFQNDTEQRKNLENVNVYKNLLDDNSVRQINSMKQEFSLLDGHLVQNKDVLKEEVNIEENQQMLEEISKMDNIQDDEEKPLISRTTRLRCSQCIKSFHTKVALQRHAIVHKHKTKLRYVCYVCDKQYSTLTKVKNHVAICHEIHDRKENIQHKRIKYEQSKTITNVQDKRINNVQDKKIKVQKNDDFSKEQRKSLKFTCEVCSKQFTYQKSFITHAKTHPEYKLEESDDSSQYSSKGRSTETVKEEEENEEEDEEDEEDENLPVESLQCTQCGKLFATKRNLKRHVSTHSGLKYTCETCGKGFSRVDKLKDHEQSKHKSELFENSDFDDKEDMDNVNKGDCLEERKKDRHNRPHKCAICPKSFAQAQSLANHIERHKRVKETQKRFLCEVCSKCFAQSGSLVAHMRTHTGVKPYVCNICSRAFTKSTYLQLHLRTHSGEKPYICQYCSRAFARANTLARHITMHTGEAKYHCQICTKSFRRLTSLNEHTYTHTGQRPYACKICTKRYNNAGSLYAHRKKCKAQQLSTPGFAVSEENSVSQPDLDVPQVLIYSHRKLVEDATVGQVTPTPQYMIANVHNQKNTTSNMIQSFSVDDPNVYAINSKQFKNPYYTIYPNM